MNSFYQSVQLLRSILEDNPLVLTTIFARTEEKDLYKKNLFPIAHINPIASPWTNSQVSQHTFEIGVFTERDINKQDTGTKFEGNDNVLDNLNTCYAIINDLVSRLYSQNNDYYAELISVSSIQPLLYKDSNILDGWAITITLALPNTISTC